MATGWICLHRQIFDNWIWDDRPYAYGQAWIDILLLANHDQSKFLLGNELVSVERGEFITSELKLMERWGWSKTKVRNFLALLESDDMIVKKADRKKTTIKVLNYSTYNISQTEKKPPENHERTAREPREDTNNNVNNVNNVNKIIECEEGRKSFGVFNNVYLTDEELDELMKQYPNEYQDMIENLSAYMRTHGKLYKDHYATMMRWKHEDQKKQSTQQYDYRKDVK